MAWIIMHDYITDKGDSCYAVGNGQFNGTPSTDRFPHTFRLRDDDGNVYYGGRYDDAAMDDDESYGGLEQAWRWGMSFAGTTDLQVRKDGAWVSVYA